MTRVQWRGVTLDSRTAKMMDEVVKLSPNIKIDPTQGSYHQGVGASAGTHDGGGAIDLSVSGLSAYEILKIVSAMRTVGFAAWHRKPSEGPWGEHIHGIAVNCPDSTPVAKRQVTALRNGKNGLRNGAKDPHAFLRIPVTSWEAYSLRKARPTVPAYPGVRDFEIGDKGSHIKLVQRGVGNPVTGVMTTADKKKVKAFQRVRPFLWPADGIVGPKTYKALSQTKRNKAFYK